MYQRGCLQPPLWPSFKVRKLAAAGGAPPLSMSQARASGVLAQATALSSPSMGGPSRGPGVAYLAKGGVRAMSLSRGAC